MSGRAGERLPANNSSAFFDGHDLTARNAGKALVLAVGPANRQITGLGLPQSKVNPKIALRNK
jgi:hypothetical protein